MSVHDFSFAPAADPETLAKFPRNDLGNARRLMLLAGCTVEDDGRVDAADSVLLYVLGLGWMGFNGVHWDRDRGEDLARNLAHQVAGVSRSLASIWASEGVPAKELWRFVDDCGSAGKTSAMLRQAQSYLTVKIDVFDRDPLALNCLNGTLKMSGGRGSAFKAVLTPHRARDRITRCTAVAFDPEATAPEFVASVQRALPDPEEYGAFHRMMGYASTGHVYEQAFFFLQGPGRDGKSTALDACREAMGSYAATAKVETFLDGAMQGGSGPQPDLIKLAGDTRLAVLSEPKRGAKLNEGLLKLWTSGSPISARDLNAKPIEFRPIGKLVWEMNAFPTAKGDDEGIWRRINPFLFRKQLKKPRDPNNPQEGEADNRLPQRIRENELPGVLNWLVAGVGDWLTRGLSPPDSLRQVLEEYRRSSSPFGDWLNECCFFGEEARVDDGRGGWRDHTESSKALHASFKAWWEDQGHDADKVMSARAFGDALRDRQIMARKDGRGNKIRGPIRLKTVLERTQGFEAEAASATGRVAAGAAIEAPEAGSFDVSPEEWEGRE